MPTARTTTDLVSDVRARVAAPAANGLVSDLDLLQLLDEEMRTEVAEMLIGVRSEYWLADYTTPIVVGQSAYRIPDRALGMALRDVTIIAPGGRERSASQIPADQRPLWSAGRAWAGVTCFTLENGSVVLLPEPAEAGHTLRLRYYASPSRLVRVADCAGITDAPTSSTLTLSSPGASITTTGSLVDVVRGGGMCEVIAADLEVTGWTSGTSTLAFAPPLSAAQLADISTPTASTAAGGRMDYACIAGTTCLPPIPESVWPALVALGARAYCEAIGDARGLAVAGAIYERKRASALGILQPRVDGEVRRPTALYTPLRGGRRRGGW